MNRIVIVALLLAAAACGKGQDQSVRKGERERVGTGESDGLPPGLRLPELGTSLRGAEPLDDSAVLFTVVATDREIVIEGNAVVALEGGLPHASDLTSSPTLHIDKVREMTKVLVATSQAHGKPLTGARLLVSPDLTYKLLLQLLMSIKQAGLKDYEIVARQGGKAVAVPIKLPDFTPVGVSSGDRATPPPLGIVVALTSERLQVFSLSGAEGTIQSPKLITTGVSSAEIARVQQALVEIHTRHTDERRIVVMVEPSVTMQLVTETLAAVRAAPDGGKLFTDVMISVGFD